MLDPTAQVRERSALPDEIVHHYVFPSLMDITFESGLTGKTTIPICTRMGNDIGLHDGGLECDPQSLTQEFCKGNWNRIDALAFVGMGANQCGNVAFADLGDHLPHCGDPCFIDQSANQPRRSHCIACFCAGIFRMLPGIGFGS